MKAVALLSLAFVCGCSPRMHDRAPSEVLDQQTEVALDFPAKLIELNDGKSVSYIKTGGQVFVSNAPESIKKPEQYNTALYRDTVQNRFRFWSSHYNHVNENLKFWAFFKNPSKDRSVILSRSSAYGAAVSPQTFTASTKAAADFMNVLPPKDNRKAVLQPGQSVYFLYADKVTPKDAVVHIAEWKAEYEDGSGASIEVADVVTKASVTDPTPFAMKAKIAPTNGDTYRGLLEHYARRGTINVTLAKGEAKWLYLATNGGYPGEQESIYSSWDIQGNKTAKLPVKSAAGKEVETFWFNEYQIDVALTGADDLRTYYGSSVSKSGAGLGGYVTYQTAASAGNYGKTIVSHFSGGTPPKAVIISRSSNYKLRTMVAAGNNLPFGLFFRAP